MVHVRCIRLDVHNFSNPYLPLLPSLHQWILSIQEAADSFYDVMRPLLPPLSLWSGMWRTHGCSSATTATTRVLFVGVTQRAYQGASMYDIVCVCVCVCVYSSALSYRLIKHYIKCKEVSGASDGEWQSSVNSQTPGNNTGTYQLVNHSYHWAPASLPFPMDYFHLQIFSFFLPLFCHQTWPHNFPRALYTLIRCHGCAAILQWSSWEQHKLWATLLHCLGWDQGWLCQQSPSTLTKKM